MAIQWFPGHMNKAKKEIADRMKSIDVVIEVLDARLPASCVSPLLDQMSAHKAKLKILNKADLADEKITQQWIAYFQAQKNTNAITLCAHERSACLKIIQACRDLVPHRNKLEKPVRVLICGVPNVGKSTLINSLLGKRAAKTGDEPGITKSEQRLILADDFWLYDTPGMLWQKITVPESGYRLAIAGSVGRNALDEEEIALELIAYLKEHYVDIFKSRFKLTAENTDNWQDETWLSAIAKKRGAILSGGRIDVQKAAEIVLHDFRSGDIGRISLETPTEWQVWLEKSKQDSSAQNSTEEES